MPTRNSPAAAAKGRLPRVVTVRIARLGARGAGDLLKILRDRRKPERARGEAAYLLSFRELFGRLSAPHRREALRVALSAFQEDKTDLTLGAAYMFQTAGEKNAWKTLSAAATSRRSDKTRFNAVYALGMLGDVRAAEPLAHILQDKGESTSLRGLAAEALGSCTRGQRRNRAISALIKALSDSSAEVRLFSANALALCGDTRALRALKKLLTDRTLVKPYGSVAAEAAYSIRTIQERLRAERA